MRRRGYGRRMRGFKRRRNLRRGGRRRGRSMWKRIGIRM